MAANTSVDITLRAKDWETLIGIMFNNGDPELQQILFQLQNYYGNLVSKPSGNTLITITSTEGVIIKLVTFIHGCNTAYVTNDIGQSAFGRIMEALRLLNNVADNYIQDQFIIFDASINATQQSIRKNGRKYIMILSYDEN